MDLIKALIKKLELSPGKGQEEYLGMHRADQGQWTGPTDLNLAVADNLIYLFHLNVYGHKCGNETWKFRSLEIQS